MPLNVRASGTSDSRQDSAVSGRSVRFELVEDGKVVAVYLA